MIQQVKKFFYELITANTGTSSKRFIALCAAFMLFAATIVNFFGIQIQVEIIYSLLTLAVGSSALTLFQKKPAAGE